MAPTAANLEEIQLQDIDFDVVESCEDKRVIKQYIKLLEADGSYFTDLLNACKGKLLKLAPKEYYLLYPRVATDEELRDARQDLLDWEDAVKETDSALKNASKDKIWTDVAPKTSMPIRGQEEAAVPQRANLQKAPKDRKPKTKQEAYARDKTTMKDYYSSWDKMDVDEIEEEFDREEREAEEARRAHFEELKEQQADMHKVSPIGASGIASEVPDAHRKHMADCEKEKGNEAFYSKDYEEAEAYYGRSLQFKADDPSAWANRALARLKLERFEGALEDCEHALALNPRFMKALHRKGKSLYELHRYEEAVKSFQLALAESPGNTQINGDLMLARRKLRSEPAAAPPPPPRFEELETRTHLPSKPQQSKSYTRVAIEEASDSEDEAPASGFQKVQIEEVSDSEGEEEAPKPQAPAFRKMVIEEVSGSEDEDEVPAPKADARTASVPFAPPPRVAEAPNGSAAGAVAPTASTFDDMD